MKSITSLVATILLLSLPAQAATLVSTLDIKRSGGTATGSFVDSTLPSILLSSSGGRFHIRNNSSITAGNSWGFLLDANGETKLQTSPTISLDPATTFSSGNSAIRINENGITLSADRFNPDPVYFLIARAGADFYAFEVATWNSGGDRMRLYSNVRQIFPSSGAVVVPEPSFAGLGSLALAALILKRRRWANY